MDESTNPNITLYHLTDTKGLIGILQHGMYPQSELITRRFLSELYQDYEEANLEELYKRKSWRPDLQARKRLNDRFPHHKDAVFFWKDERDTEMSMDIKIPVKAEKIPCRCLEANWETASELMDLYVKDYIQSPLGTMRDEEIVEKIKNAERKYEDSVRPLSEEKNEYKTEVMCPCHIPTSAIVHPNGFRNE